MNYKEVFYRLINEVENKEFKKFCAYVADHIPSYFWEVPATSSGKYHPNFAKGEYGLVKHSLMVYRIARDLLETRTTELETDRDVILMACLFHDCCKRGENNEPTEHTLFNHPYIASNFIYDVWLTCSDKVIEDNCGTFDRMTDMCRLIECHMGKWNTSKYAENVELPIPYEKDEKIVHIADYMASRVYCEFDEGYFEFEQ